MIASSPLTYFNKFFPNEEAFDHVKDNLLALLFELEDCGITMFDATGHVITCNVGAEKIYGINREQLVGRHFSDFYSVKEIESGQHEQNLKLVKEVGRIEYEGWKPKPGGNVFYANTIVTAVKNKVADIVGYAKITRDITAQKKLEAEKRQINEVLEEKVKQRTRELEVVNKELEAFSYSVSHDLRTPLRAITGYSTMLMEDYGEKLDAEAGRIINVIVKNTAMMSELIDNLLTFSKLSRLEVVDETVNMLKLVDDSIQELLETSTTKNYAFTIHDIPGCRGDKNMLKQVWSNLLSNAIKYSSKNTTPKVEVGAVDDDKATIYYVRDNGSGFDMKYSGKLFGVFQRLHRNDEFEGTGLGLALAKRIISKHEGEIWAEASINHGATFYFSIPKRTSNE